MDLFLQCIIKSRKYYCSATRNQRKVLEMPRNENIIHLNISFGLKGAAALITVVFTSLTAI